MDECTVFISATMATPFIMSIFHKLWAAKDRGWRKLWLNHLVHWLTLVDITTLKMKHKDLRTLCSLPWVYWCLPDLVVLSLPGHLVLGLWLTSKNILHFLETSLYPYLRLPYSLQLKVISSISSWRFLFTTVLHSDPRVGLWCTYSPFFYVLQHVWATHESSFSFLCFIS